MSGGELSGARLARMRAVMHGHVQGSAVPGLGTAVSLDFWTTLYAVIDD